MRQNSLDRDAAIEPLEPALLCEKYLCHPAARNSAQEDVLAEPNAGAIRSHATILSGPADTRRAVNEPARRDPCHRRRRPRCNLGTFFDVSLVFTREDCGS
jgi:hypothetical protein